MSKTVDCVKMGIVQKLSILPITVLKLWWKENRNVDSAKIVKWIKKLIVVMGNSPILWECWQKRSLLLTCGMWLVWNASMMWKMLIVPDDVAHINLSVVRCVGFPFAPAARRTVDKTSAWNSMRIFGRGPPRRKEPAGVRSSLLLSNTNKEKMAARCRRPATWKTNRGFESPTLDSNTNFVFRSDFWV